MAGTGGSNLAYGKGSALWKYWTSGKGKARWANAEHKWTTLRNLLIAAGVPARSANGLATNIIEAVMPSYLKKKNDKKLS